MLCTRASMMCRAALQPCGHDVPCRAQHAGMMCRAAVQHESMMCHAAVQHADMMSCSMEGHAGACAIDAVMSFRTQQAAGSMVAAVPSVAVCRRTQGCSAAAARASQWCVAMTFHSTVIHPCLISGMGYDHASPFHLRHGQASLFGLRHGHASFFGLRYVHASMGPKPSS